jgi:hypothetical protein
MSSLSLREQAMVESCPDFTGWIVFPPPRRRQESAMYKRGKEKRLKIKNFLRSFLKLMVDQYAEDARVRKDKTNIGAYSEAEWAKVTGYLPSTIAKYIGQIEEIFFNAGLKPYEEILEVVTDGDWEGVRVRLPVVFLSATAAVKTRKRRRRRRKPSPRKPHPR